MSHTPGPGERDYWPEFVNFEATYEEFDDATKNRWHVFETPPPPWPMTDDYPRAIYGPPGTVWTYQPSELAQRITSAEQNIAQRFIQYFLKFAKINPLQVGTESDPSYWTVPNRKAQLMTADVYRVTIHAKVDTDEESCNVLHYRDASPTAPSEARCQQIATLMAGHWSDFMNATIAGGGVVAAQFASTTVFDEVRCAAIHLAPPAKPDYVVLTQYAPFTGAPVKGSGTPLPYEVALVVSMNTSWRGPRGRGRTYLGPLAQSLMSTNGNFDTAKVQGIANAWTNAMATGPAADATIPLHLVVASLKFGQTHDVIDTRVGQVPDSQRRRRRSRSEQYQVGASV